MKIWRIITIIVFVGSIFSAGASIYWFDIAHKTSNATERILKDKETSYQELINRIDLLTGQVDRLASSTENAL